jgi:2-hydroxy-3-oxopropionate reductase
MRGASMLEHNFQPGFRVNLHRKDLGIALATGREQQVPLPVTALVAQMFETLAATGRGDLDHSSYITIVEGLAGYTIESPD